MQQKWFLSRALYLYLTLTSHHYCLILSLVMNWMMLDFSNGNKNKNYENTHKSRLSGKLKMQPLHPIDGWLSITNGVAHVYVIHTQFGFFDDEDSLVQYSESKIIPLHIQLICFFFFFFLFLCILLLWNWGALYNCTRNNRSIDVNYHNNLQWR